MNHDSNCGILFFGGNNRVILYHGTSERYLKRILTEGLQPRIRTKTATNYKEHPSNRHCVYLTDCYAPYFAAVASKQERWAIVELEVDESSLLPDEDFIEQATRSRVSGSDLKARTKAIRAKLDVYADYALDSLNKLGTVATKEVITVSQIRRISLFAPEDNPYIMMMALDPSISILNHLFMAQKYVNLTRWFFEAGISPEDLGTHWEFLSEVQRDLLRKAVADRSGIEIITP